MPLLTFRTRPTHTATTEVFIHIQLSIWYIIPQLTNLQRDSIKINKIQQALHVAQYIRLTPYVENITVFHAVISMLKLDTPHPV